MKLHHLLIVLLSMHCGLLSAQERKALHAGLEWGPGFTVAESHHSNYISSVGYRVDESGSSFCPHFTGHVSAYAGVYAYDGLSISLHAGWAGLQSGRQLVPVFVRTDWYPGGNIVFFDLGTDALTIASSNTLLAGLGAGRRIPVGAGLFLDLRLSARILQGAGTIIDDDSGLPVPEEDIRQNSAGVATLQFGVSLGF